MSQDTVDSKRRTTLLGAVAVIAGVPLARLARAAETGAAEPGAAPETGAAEMGAAEMGAAETGGTELPHLSEDDPTARALSYHHDATQAKRADKGGIPADQQFCHNCQFIQADSGDWRPCQIFPGKAVNANGWCASWIQQTG